MKTTLQLIAALFTVGGMLYGLAIWSGMDLPVRMSQHLEDVKRIERMIVTLFTGQSRRSIANSIRIINTELAVLKNREVTLETDIVMMENRLKQPFFVEADKIAMEARVLTHKREVQRVHEQILDAERERVELVKKMQENDINTQVIPPRTDTPPP